MTTLIPGLALLAAIVLGCWYAVGLRRLLEHPQSRRQQRLRAPAVLAGAMIVLVVNLPPLGERLEERMSTHMGQHLMILSVATPLLAYGSPAPALLAALPPRTRHRLAHAVHRLPRFPAPLAWLVFVATLWVWHLPAAYDAAVRSDSVHLLEHASFLVAGWLFWHHLVRLARTPGRGIAAGAYVAAVVPPGAALGAVLTFPDHPLYPAQAEQARALGMDPLLDQRIAGLVMWVPLDLVYLGAAIWLFARWVRELQGATAEQTTETLPYDARAEVTR